MYTYISVVLWSSCGMEVVTELKFESLLILFYILLSIPPMFILNFNLLHSFQRNISIRVELGLRRGSIRSTYPNPNATLTQPYRNPFAS